MKSLFYLCSILLVFTTCKNIGKVSEKEEDLMNYGSPKKKLELATDKMFLITEYTKDKTYGYTEKNPIMVGGFNNGDGPLNEVRFLNALGGPKGEIILFKRLYSCCDFFSKNSKINNNGRLDVYEVTYKGLKTPVLLYINMYDSDTLKVPVGLSLRHQRLINNLY